VNDDDRFHQRVDVAAGGLTDRDRHATNANDVEKSLNKAPATG
jgi:hypothetical protein